MAYSPGVNDISGQLIGQGIASLGAGISQGVERQQKEKNILQEASGRGRALAQTFKGLEQLGLVPEGQVDQIRQAQESMSPREFMGFADNLGQNLGAIMQGGMQMRQVEAAKAKQAEFAKAMDAARVATQQATKADGTIDVNAAMTIYAQRGGQDNAILAETVRMAQGQGGAGPTAAMRETDAILADELKAGKLQNDPAAIASRRADLLARGGRDTAEKYFNAGVFVDRETGGSPIQASREANSGRVGTVNDKGEFVPLDMSRYKPTTASDANVYLQESDMKKLSDALILEENGIKALNRYAKSAGGIPQGVEKIATRIGAAVKTVLTQEPLTDEEKAMGISDARQQRLLGALRTTVLGPGVLTENDAARIINAIGGDITAVTTNPQVVQDVVQELLTEKMASYRQNLNIYNRHVAGRYSQAGYEQRAAVEPYKPEEKAATPAQESTKTINGVLYQKTPDGWVRK